MKLRLALSAITILFSSAVMASPDSAECTQLDQAAQSSPSFHPSVSFTVVGTGRLYLHSAPAPQCKHKDIFVIPGDSLTAYVAHKGWVQVMYINSKTGNDFTGWVQESRLHYNGKNAPF